MLHMLQLGSFKVLTTLLFLESELLAALTPGAALPASFGDPTCDFLLGFLQLVYFHCSIWPILPPSANAAFAPYPRLQTSYPFSAHFEIPPLHPRHRLMLLAAGCFSLPSASSSLPYSLRVLQRNAGGLLARSTELQHYISSHPVSLVCIPGI